MSYVSQAVGLQHISSNPQRFSDELECLDRAPFLVLLVGESLRLQVVGAAVLACVGIGFMSWESGSNLLGDAVTVLCALAYAVYILLLSQRARLHSSRTLAATQIVAMALISAVCLAVVGLRNDSLKQLYRRRVRKPVIASIVYLGVIASAAMIFLQAVGQRVVSAGKAAVVYALEPVFAALFGWWWLHESMTPRALLGGALVVLAVILGEWRFTPAALYSKSPRS